LSCSRAIALCALLAACSRGSGRSAPRPLSVQPSAAYTAADVPVTIAGEHFEPVATQRVGEGGGVDVDSSFRAFLGAVELKDVQWQAPDRLTAAVPAGLSGGPFDLRVVGPTGEGALPSAFVGSTGKPAAVAATLSAPARAELGTQAEVDVVLTNTGQAALAAPKLELLADPGVALVALPGVGDAIQPGKTVHLVGLVAAESRGPATLTLHVSGEDAFDGSTVDVSQSASIQVVTPASLSVATVPVPDLVSVGQSLDLVATVANQGDVDALAVTVGAPAVSGTGGSLVGSAPPPQDIPAGASRTFHVAAHATSPGAVFFIGTASGSDAITGLPTSVGTNWPIVFVQAAAQISARWLTVPSMAVPGQSFIATLGVSNGGEALARDVAPVPNPPSVAAGGSATLSGSPATAPVDVPGGSTAVFSWTFTPAGTPPDSLTLTASAGGADANSGAALSAGPLVSPAIALTTPSALIASMSTPAGVLRGDTFTVTLSVTDSGGVGVNAVTPSDPIASGTGAVQRLTGPVPASQNLAGGATGSFTWTYAATSNGAIALSASVSGTDAITPTTTRSASAGATVAISDAVQVASAPLGATTRFAYVFDFNGRVYLGPGADGTGGVRMLPDGSSPEPVTLGFRTDPVNGNFNGAINRSIWPTLGFTNCVADTPQCGPDNENGRGLFASGIVGGKPWLIASGARTNDVLSHVYATADTGGSPVFSYDYVAGALSSQVRGTSSMLVFRDRVYLGFSDTSSIRPTYLVLRKMPSAPGSTPTAGVDVVNLRVDRVSGFGASALLNRNTTLTQMIDSQVAFNDLLYIANNGGIIHSSSNDPQPPLVGQLANWVTSTPGAAAYAVKSSITTRKTLDLEPADKAFPQMAAFGGKLYAGRNTTAGPQLWACTPGPNQACDPADWVLLAANGVGDTGLSQFDDPQNVRVALVAATSGHLYVGYNNVAGLVLYRSRAPAPSSRADFEGAAGCDASLAPSSCDGLGGRGLGAGATRIFDGRVLTYGGKDYVYLTAGNGSSGFRVFRLVQ
jgi:hypothetical protein